MRGTRWRTALVAAALVMAVVLGFLSFPNPADATCYPWEYEERWVTVSYEGCCDEKINGGLYKRKLERRYRVPNCDWGPWQDTGVRVTVCHSGACRFVA